MQHKFSNTIFMLMVRMIIMAGSVFVNDCTALFSNVEDKKEVVGVGLEPIK